MAKVSNPLPIIQERLKIVGESPTRKGIEALVSGEAKFTGDFDFPDMLVGRILRSPFPQPRIIPSPAFLSSPCRKVYNMVGESPRPARGLQPSTLRLFPLSARNHPLQTKIAARTGKKEDTMVETQTPPFIRQAGTMTGEKAPVGQNSSAPIAPAGSHLGKPSQVSVAMMVHPNRGRYFELGLPVDDVLLLGITVSTSDPEVPFRFLLFEREQLSDHYDHADVFWEEPASGRRLTYIEPRPRLYRDRDGCTKLHCGIALEGRPMRFDIESSELADYLARPVTFETVVSYQAVLPHEKSHQSEPAGTPSTREVIESLLRIKIHQRLKPSTLRTYEKHLAVFEREHPRLPSDPETILGYLERFDGESGRTRLNIQAELSMLYRHAADRFGVSNPMAGLPPPRVRHKPVNTLSLAQVAALDNTPTSLRDRAALDMLLGHGWRQIEVRRITAGDVLSIHDGLIWVRGKEREEWTPVLPESREWLEALAKGRKKEERIFRGQRGNLGEDGMSQLIARLYARAGLRGMHGHDLRRTFSTQVREASSDEFLAMRLLRDRVPGLNNRYIAVSPDQLRNALYQYSPLRLTKKTGSQNGSLISAGGDGGAPVSP